LQKLGHFESHKLFSTAPNYDLTIVNDF
jgi:hypothetical protein